jgi:hypothetical protein
MRFGLRRWLHRRLRWFWWRWFWWRWFWWRLRLRFYLLFSIAGYASPLFKLRIIFTPLFTTIKFISPIVSVITPNR